MGPKKGIDYHVLGPGSVHLRGEFVELPNLAETIWLKLTGNYPNFASMEAVHYTAEPGFKESELDALVELYHQTAEPVKMQVNMDKIAHVYDLTPPDTSFAFLPLASGELGMMSYYPVELRALPQESRELDPLLTQRFYPHQFGVFISQDVAGARRGSVYVGRLLDNPSPGDPKKSAGHVTMDIRQPAHKNSFYLNDIHAYWPA